MPRVRLTVGIYDIAELVNYGSRALVALESFNDDCFNAHYKTGRMKEKLQELQGAVNSAKSFAKTDQTSSDVRKKIIRHAKLSSQHISGLKKNLNNHTAKRCWANGKKSALEKQTRDNTASLKDSVGLLGLNCVIALQSFEWCDPIDTKADTPQLIAMKKKLLIKMYPRNLADLIKRSKKADGRETPPSFPIILGKGGQVLSSSNRPIIAIMRLEDLPTILKGLKTQGIEIQRRKGRDG
ncbi:hypothetical protein CFIO01_04419 [Colletotrichum fioriniae PJ7]|uniref:Uncharacterized protein n=1 Tax=Colletotrichum fioriniae PJ7 TaxID=1445577 RepID=A0A010RXY5_9PEZI|nr:hypothetical protein CFIO01_04419 [Colletotrichum fioriniae PJ7]